jgi:hypothetical protein
MAALLIVEADAAIFDHGETEDKPIPVPRESRISDNAAATNAPAITAAQDTPDECASFLAKLSANPDGLLTTVDDPVRSMLTSLMRYKSESRSLLLGTPNLDC